MDLSGQGGKEDLGEVEEEATTIRMYCMKKNLFLTKNKNNLKRQ